MRYWYKADSGALVAEVRGESARGHSGFGQTPDLELPAPLACCKWDGVAIVVDAARLAAHKAELRRRVEDQAVTTVQDAVLATPFGDFRIQWSDLSAYVLMGFAAVNAIQTNSAFSVSLRRADDTLATFTAQQFVRFLALVGERAAANFGARDAKINALAAASAAQLKSFEP